MKQAKRVQAKMYEVVIEQNGLSLDTYLEAVIGLLHDVFEHEKEKDGLKYFVNQVKKASVDIEEKAKKIIEAIEKEELADALMEGQEAIEEAQKILRGNKDQEGEEGEEGEEC